MESTAMDPEIAATSSTQARFRSSSNPKAKRNYRPTRRDDSDHEGHDLDLQEQAQSTETKAETEKQGQDGASTLPYVRSQNAQNLGEVYPALARLSFLDQEQGDIGDDPGANFSVSKPRRPLKQAFSDGKQTSDSTERQLMSSKEPAVDATLGISLAVPPMTSPAALNSAIKNQIVIRECEQIGKGRGLFYTGKESLVPGSLIFKELGYCQVVNDASLSKVCSTCFKDTREEQGEEEQSSGTGSVAAGGQRKLVRCAGCRIVWYCNKTCQIKDWKLHHQLECQGIQKSLSNPGVKDVWTKHKMDTTTVRALCRLIRRRERVKISAQYKAEHGGKLDAAQKQVNEVYFSGLDQKEDEWLDENGAAWIQQFLSSNEIKQTTTSDATTKKHLDEPGQFAKIMAVVMSCVVSPKEDPHVFLKGLSELPGLSEHDAGDGGLELTRKLDSYGFVITNLETTMAIGLALYVQSMPFLNHSCVPNCIYTFRGARVECRAIRKVQPGEELTISYIDQIDLTKVRQRHLQDQYHFTCDCPLCKFFPANPMVLPEQEDLLDVLAPSKPLCAPSLDPKQGWICPNPSCKAARHTVLAVDSQLEIYNNVKLHCSTCGYEEILTQELEQENREEAERLLARFVREMNGGSASKGNGARNFELAKFSAETTASEDGSSTEPIIVGGLRTVQEPSGAALRAFAAAYRTLTGTESRSVILANSTSRFSDTDEHLGTNHGRSSVHHLVRGLVQAAFDEAVSHKHWIFALERSIELNRILNEVYIGHHPVKAVQNYYTCKIANLLANLLLEESTVEIEESDESDESDDDKFGDSDDERDLTALKNAMTASRAKVGDGSMQDMLSRRGREGSDDNSTKNSDKKQRQQQRRSQAENSKKVLQFLKELVPKLEDSSILQQFQICWGKDGRLASRYRHQVDSLKQALHYAELPFAKSEKE
ncbi:hypothetical protein EMPS_06284 [Entomortierella parvispora]|uniref:SET domain-containing protein n=1 Tax=Entomortierella parvispora TaxID=205924 RepID=A0A9P3HC01_9FUNG|nr:hypothetical protein EMPS_06284 [Entomortierella parvispora]